MPLTTLLHPFTRGAGIAGIAAAHELAEVLVDVTKVAQQAVGDVRMVTKDNNILKLCIEMNRLEGKADRIHHKAQASRSISSSCSIPSWGLPIGVTDLPRWRIDSDTSLPAAAKGRGLTYGGIKTTAANSRAR